MVTVSFPGLGIGEFSFNRVAFSIGPFEVRWYGLLIVTGIILAFLYANYRAKYEGIKFDDLLDYAIFTVVAGVVGARLYYVITSGREYSFGEIFAVWNGGLAIYGGVIGGAIALFLVSIVKKIKWQKAFDMVAPAVMIGQIIGRWGNFFNGEAYGATPSEDSLLYVFRMHLKREEWSSTVCCQPTFLYESLWNLVGFIIITLLYKKKKFDGQIVLMYLTWYGFGRMFIEGLRTDSLYVGEIRISQLVGFLCFIAGLGLIIFFTIRAVKKERLTPAFVDGVEGGDTTEGDGDTNGAPEVEVAENTDGDGEDGGGMHDTDVTDGTNDGQIKENEDGSDN